MSWLAEPQAWVALVTLTALELVLGIDNIIFISILTGKLPVSQRQKGRTIGLVLAMAMRIALLMALAWIVRLTQPLFTVLSNEISGRDLILILGGIFLLGKSTQEIHQKLEGVEGESSTRVGKSFAAIMVQIILLDIVFSLDSVITAVGMVREIPIMVTAVVLAVGLMMVFAKPVGEFVEQHPTVKMLALAFLLLVGMALVADGLDHHIPRGYIYFAMGFSVLVEMLNLRLRKFTQTPVRLHEPYVEGRSN
ncbi:MAG: TerC family protein [Thermoanaerobaculia bacterium]